MLLRAWAFALGSKRKTEMALAIVLGIVAGLVGFVPLFVALRLSRRSTSTSALTAGMYGLGGSFVSLIVLAVCMIACAMLDRGNVLPFGIAEMATIIVVTSVYVLYKNVLAKKKTK